MSRVVPSVCCLLFVGCLIAVSASARGAEPPVVTGKIERFDPRFDKLVPRDAAIEKLAEGFKWAEGPAWLAQEGCLLFSDIPRNSVMRWKDGAGLSVFLNPSGYTGSDPRGGEMGANGLLVDRQGRLVLCQHGDRRLARRETDGRFVTLCDRYQGKRFNSPNDAVQKSNGDFYFTDPPYGLADKSAQELAFCGVYRCTPSGQVTLLTERMTRPNGLAFSPDEKTLYVAQSDPEQPVWMAFDVQADGTLGAGHIFADARSWPKTLKGLPDGMKVDRAGNLFCTGPGGVNVFAPDGTLLGRIGTGQLIANCAFGDDGSMLYLTSHMFLCRVKTTARGW